MRTRTLKAEELLDVIAVGSISVGFIMAIILDQHDLALALGGSLAGVLGVSTKNGVLNGYYGEIAPANTKRGTEAKNTIGE